MQMRAGAWVVALLLLLQGAAQAETPSGSQPREQRMQRWEKAAAWKQYKRYYTKVPQVKTASAVEALDTAISDWEVELERLFPENPQLVLNLKGVLDERIKARLRAVQPSRGRPPKPDYPDTLSRSMKRLRLEYGALKGLRALEGKDPWVEEAFLPDVQHTRAAVAAVLTIIERSATDDPRVPPLRQEAQALLRELQESLGDIPEKLRVPSQ